MSDLPDDGDGGSAGLCHQLPAARLPPPHDRDGVISVCSTLQSDLLALVGGHHAVSLHREPGRG